MNEKLPIVSIIVPVKDGTSTLTKALRSLETLDYPKDKLEIILIDDHSSVPLNDSIHSNLENPAKNRNLFLFQMPTNVGFYACMNHGIKKSKGEVIVLYAHDLFADKNFLRQAVKALYSRSNIGGVRCRVETDFEHLMPPLYFAPVGMYPLVYRKDIFKKVGLFDERFRSRGDSDFEFRVIKAGYQITDCPSSTVYHPLRKLSWKTLWDYCKRRQYDALLFAKHNAMSKKILGGRLTRPVLGPISMSGYLFLSTLLFIVINEFSLRFPLTLLAALALTYFATLGIGVLVWTKFFHTKRTSARESLEFFFWSQLFVLAVILGRLYGSLKFRKLIL